MKRNKLRLIAFLLTFISWLILVYIFGIIFIKFNFGDNLFLNTIFMDRELLKVKGLRNSGFNGNTIFDLVLLFCSGYFWKKILLSR